MRDKDTRKASESIVYPTVNLLDDVDLFFMVNLKKARQIFASRLSNGLKLSLDSVCAAFKPIYQKFDTRRMDEIYSF